MIKRVLITGASGFIGQHLVKAALDEGFEVHAAVRRSSNTSELKVLGEKAEENKTGKLLFVYPDFNSKEALLDLFKSSAYSHVIHAAGVTRAKETGIYNEINATYTLRLAQAALEAGFPLKRFVFMSSLAALGPIQYNSPIPIDEYTDPRPVTSYGKSKLLAESYLAELTKLPLTTIRPTAVYGPGEKDIYILFKTLSKGLDLYIGQKPQRLSFVYVHDLVAATMAALNETDVNHTVYNISDGREYNRYQLADLFRNFSKNKLTRIHLPVGVIKLTAEILEICSTFSRNAPVLNREKIGELTAENWNCSIEKAKVRLGYTPQFELEKGVYQTLSWYREHQWL
ncbi:NAD(P)-dependent oxidoreductase [Dyadobacter luteus]|jgi:nucleoside-diphosphate-sugar epimerase|uniref:NAD(P)-dependent oxidoreductase n=1 Tax=Dyadobacter luteus TaxID=2259619 RepID=A0A3D8YFL3_9BACT|nr:NAD-dependent epimerase/dehydratase family protein [Dyadobacter luteus]REA63275.1 NAD(P)-dependent oxidoreductase [Dyadobacter luteus]